MRRLSSGIVAGFAATVVLSVVMLFKSSMGLMPELDVIAMLSRMMNAPTIMGWMGHFAIGTLAWGISFALIRDILPSDDTVVQGILFGVGAWLTMMIVVMPLAGSGLFGLQYGPMAPVATLLLHIIFGAVLGMVFTAAETAFSQSDR